MSTRDDVAALIAAEARMGRMEQELREYTRLFERLDEAMATPERIARDTALVGDFVSSLDVTEAAEEIVDRACEKLRGAPVNLRPRPRFQRSGLLSILLTLDEDGNYQVASVLGDLDPEPGKSRSDAEWCEASLRESGADFIFNGNLSGGLMDAPSLLVTGYMVGEDLSTQDGVEYDEHFKVESMHRVTTMAEVRGALAPMMTNQATKTWDLADQQPEFKRAWLDAVWPEEDQ